VWAALEKCPKIVANRLKTEDHPGDTQQKTDKMDRGRHAVDHGQPVVDSEQGELGGGRATDAGARYFVGLEEPTSQRESVASDPSPLSPSLPPTQQEQFRPVWQVDHFTWPRLCRRLIARAAEELDRLADALLAANVQGQKVLAIGGCRRGEGATTLLLCAARRLAERGIKPVLVDADLVRPRLAKRLGVKPQFGWDETAEEDGRPLDQAIVEATTNNVALLPAREPSAESHRPPGDASRLPACLGILREHYDMVLVDLGPLEDARLADGDWSRTARSIDALVLVHNPRITSTEQLTAFQEQVAAAGIAVAGIVENFVVEA
jgi:Mrp family chromosome partitioning ATPase